MGIDKKEQDCKPEFQHQQSASRNAKQDGSGRKAGQISEAGEYQKENRDPRNSAELTEDLGPEQAVSRIVLDEWNEDVSLEEQPSQEQHSDEQMQPGNKIYTRPRDPFNMQRTTCSV